MKLPGANLVSAIKRAAGGNAGYSWFNSTITAADAMAGLYSTRDSKMWELVPRMIGVADQCVTYNTNACVSVPLRLYRMVDETTSKERKKYPGKKMTPGRRARIKAMKSGRMGTKTAMLANTGGDVEEVSDHPILDFVYRPNPIFPGTTMAQMRFRNKWGFGEYYDRIIDGPDGMPLTAWPLYPQFTKIQFSETGYIEMFNYGRDQSSPKRYSPKEVVFYKHRPALHHPLRGESPLSSVLPQLDILYKNMMHDIAFVAGGNRPDSLVTVKDPKATDKQIKQIEARIRQMATGGIASVKAFVTRDVDWKPLSFAPKDLNTPEKLDRYERHIRAQFGHTESMADSTETNVASAVIGYSAQFMGGTIHPALINDAAELNEFIIPRFGYSHGEYFLCYDDPVTADMEKENAAVRADILAGKITANEGREKTGEVRLDIPEADDLRINGVKLGVLDAGPSADPTNPLSVLFSGGRAGGSVDDGTGDPNLEAPDADAGAEDRTDDDATPPDVVAGVVSEDDGTDAVGVVDQQTPTEDEKVADTALNGAQIASLVDLAVRVTTGELPKETAREIALASFPGISDDQISRIFGGLEKVEQPDEKSIESWLVRKHGKVQDIARAIKFENESPPCGCCSKDAGLTGDPEFDGIIRDTFPKFFEELVESLAVMQNEVVVSIARGGTPDVSKQTQIIADMLLSQFSPVVEDMAASTVASLVAGGLDTPGSNDFVPTQAIDAYKEHVSLVASDIAKHTEELIKPAVERGMELGLPVGEIVSEIENADIPAWRAERIARTEISEATNGARYDTMEEVGVEKVKVVNAPSPSESHAIIAARSPLPIGSNFVEAGETIGKETFKTAKKRPPFRPNCRCRIEPVL